MFVYSEVNLSCFKDVYIFLLEKYGRVLLELVENCGINGNYTEV